LQVRCPLPPDLIDFQREFAAALASPSNCAMAVYRNTVFHGAVEALRANYPVTEQILGTEMFDQVAVDFATENPPQSPILAMYGEAFADWLTEQPWVGDLAYLPDVARVERMHIRCLFAPDNGPQNRDRGAAIGTLRLHPGVHFAWLSTPAMSIWLAHQQTVRREVAPEWKPEGALFARRDTFHIHALRIGRPAHRMLSGIRLAETVSAAMAAATHLYPEEDCAAVFASLANLCVFAAPERIN